MTWQNLAEEVAGEFLQYEKPHFHSIADFLDTGEWAGAGAGAGYRNTSHPDFFPDRPNAQTDRFLRGDESTRSAMRVELATAHIQADHPKESDRIQIRRWGLVTTADAARIRSLKNQLSGHELARRYGVAPITIQRILNNRTFRKERTRIGANEAKFLKNRRDRAEAGGRENGSE